VDQPGRAYLRAGSGEPTELQVARVATPPAADTAAVPEIRRWTWPVTVRPPGAEAASPGGSDLARLAAGLTRHAGATGVVAPHRPWRSPLPDELSPGTLEELSPGRHRDPTRLHLGLLDLPDRQAQEPLELDLAEGGAWLAVGGPRSGRTTLLRSVLAEAVNRLAPADLHVHVVEAGGGLADEAAALPHTGTSIRGTDALRTSRLIDRLTLEVAARRAAGPRAPAPLILLLIDGIDAVNAVLDEAEPAAGSAALLRLLRDGAAVGLTCVLTGDRALPGGRLAAAVRERLVLPLPDRAEYAMAGIPARAVPTHRPPGRALVGEEALECQLVLPRPLASLPGTLPAGAGHPAPLRIAELHPDPALPLPRDIEAGADAGALVLPVGPGGDEGRPLAVDLMRTGGLLVTGPPGSGRSSALDAFTQHLTAYGAHVLRVGHRFVARSGAEPAAWLDPEDVDGARRWLDDRSTRPCVVVADDVGTPAEFPVLSALPALGSRTGVALVAAATAGQLAGHYQGPVAHLRRSRSGLLLCPGAGDAEVLGLRLPRTPLPARPGSGWLATGTRLERVQVARRRDPVVEARPMSSR
jgi:S-DNA-T family DNA segregation ATPase FtsK/SpoIIIE